MRLIHTAFSAGIGPVEIAAFLRRAQTETTPPIASRLFRNTQRWEMHSDLSVRPRSFVKPSRSFLSAGSTEPGQILHPKHLQTSIVHLAYLLPFTDSSVGRIALLRNMNRAEVSRKPKAINITAPVRAQSLDRGL